MKNLPLRTRELITQEKPEWIGRNAGRRNVLVGIQWLDFSQQCRKQRHPWKKKDYRTSCIRQHFGFSFCPHPIVALLLWLYRLYVVCLFVCLSLSSTSVLNAFNIILNDLNALGLLVVNTLIENRSTRETAAKLEFSQRHQETLLNLWLCILFSSSNFPQGVNTGVPGNSCLRWT